MVVGGDVDAQVVHVDGVFLPHAVQQHHHPDVGVDAHRDVGVLHDGDLHPGTRRTTLQQGDPHKTTIVAESGLAVDEVSYPGHIHT